MHACYISFLYNWFLMGNHLSFQLPIQDAYSSKDRIFILFFLTQRQAVFIYIYSIMMEGPEGIHPFANSMSEEIGFELNLHRVSCKESCFKDDERCMCSSVKKNVENKAQEACRCCAVVNKDNFKDEEVGIHGIIHLPNSHGQLARPNPIYQEKNVSNSEEISIFLSSATSDSIEKKCMMNSASFPSSEVEYSHSLPAERKYASSSTDAPVQNAVGDQLRSYTCSISPPASSKLVSAMKGGRAHNGILPRMDMRVKWAVDVYDPPASLMSHTVKSNNYQRPKSKKKDNQRNKHRKGKNSRGNSSERKLSNPRNIGSLSGPFQAKLHASGANKADGRGKSAIEVLEIAVGSVQDVKCGSIFLRESLAKVHVSFGEAT